MRIRLTRGWGAYVAGDIISPPAALREWLMLNGDAVVADVDVHRTAPDEIARPRRGRPPKHMMGVVQKGAV